MRGETLRRRAPVVALLAVLVLTLAASAGAANEARVTVGSPTTPFPRNKQNEPSVAIDASRPLVLAAGSNEEIDNAPCGTTIFATDESPCPFTPGVGGSGVHFSFDGGRSWVQPTYTGWSARTGTPMVGPDRHAAVVLRERPRLRRRPCGRVRAGPAERDVLLGERLAALLREPDLQLPGRADRLRRGAGGARRGGGARAQHGAPRAGLRGAGAREGRRGNRGLAGGQRVRGELQREEHLAAAGARVEGDLGGRVRRQGADLGRQRRELALLRQRLRLLRRLQRERRRPAGRVDLA